MENLAKAYGDSFKTSSKFITQKNGIGEIFTPKSLNFRQALIAHLLGKTRLGVAPEIKGQEDKILFGGIDIDCKDLPTEEKYKMALSLQNNLFEEYRLNALIEQSKSKGFHIFIFFSVPQKRDYIQNLLEKVVTKVTGKKIANGVIEIFPKGKKGNAMFLPCFGMFQNENTLSEEFFELKKSCFVEGKNMEAITNPLTRIKNSMQVNSSMLMFQESLSKYPDCIRKAALNWKDGERNSLTMAIAGVLKKVAKISLDEAINVITEIAQFNRDEELLGRIATVESTYKNEDVAGCSIMKGENPNISLSEIICDSDCIFLNLDIPIKDKVRYLQAKKELQANIKKDKIAELVISELLTIGKIYKTDNQYYIFTNDEKRLICISDEPLELRTLFTEWGINASENLYKYILNELYVYCVKNAENVEIHRFAYYNPTTFTLYLYNGIREILKITADSIETIENGDEGIMFMELKNYQPFKLVETDKKFDYVEEYLTDRLNIDSEASILDLSTQRKIAKIWIYSLFFESIMKTKPIFTAIGTKGSGKTTFLRRVGQILFGEKFDVTAIANDCKDLETIITNNYYVVIDNLDNPPKALNDTLARIATGQIIKKRKLFTTNQELEFEVKCFVALTSRTPQFTRDDVADRLICVYLERYELFTDENNLCRETLAKRNEIMSHMIYKIQDYIKKLYKTKDITFSVDFRMADFAVFALKTAENKKEENELKKIFSTMIKIQNEFTLKDDVLYILLKDFVKDPVYKNQRFTPAELYQKFKLKADEHGLLKPFEVVYKNPKAVSTRLKNIKDNIKDEILIHYKKGHGNQYYFSFKLVDESEYQESLI